MASSPVGLVVVGTLESLSALRECSPCVSSKTEQSNDEFSKCCALFLALAFILYLALRFESNEFALSSALINTRNARTTSEPSSNIFFLPFGIH